MGERGLALRQALEHKAAWLHALPEPWLVPLVEAAMIGDLALVRNLLAEGADPDRASPLPNWNTALEYAVRDNALEMARCLLDHGADPNRKGWEGVTPLMIATVHNHVGT
jgi:ankyrin repeat protein